MNKITVPQEKTVDKIINIAKSALDIVVPLSSTVLETFLTFPYEKRKNLWRIEVTDTLNELASKSMNIDSLKEDQAFLDILIQAVQIGIKTHKEEKRKYLKNAIIHSAIVNSLEFTKQQIFLNFIDVFTVDHISLLILMNDPMKSLSCNNKTSGSMGGVSSIRSIISKIYPELIKNNLIGLLWNDLYNSGLLESNKDIIVLTMTPDGALNRRTTPLGSEFIQFITDN